MTNLKKLIELIKDYMTLTILTTTIIILVIILSTTKTNETKRQITEELECYKILDKEQCKKLYN